MMSSGSGRNLTNPTSHDVQMLMGKFEDPDSDIRYMTLVDLCSMLTNGSPNLLLKDYNGCNRIIDGLIRLLDDSNGDVQSQALKCIGPLAAKAPPEILTTFIDKLSTLDPVKSQDLSISPTSTRTLIVSFPRPVPGVPPTKQVQDAYDAISRVLIPRFLGQAPTGSGNKRAPRGMLEVDETSGANVDALELLNETIRCFGPMFNERELQSLQKKLMEIADHPRSGAVAKKKAITSMSNLSVYLTDTLLNQFVSSSIESFNSGDLELWKRRLLFTMLGSIARSVPRKLGPHLKNLVPFVLDSLSQDEYLAALENIGEDIDPMEDEVKEAALIALDDFLSSCVNEMRPFTELSIEAAIRYLNYDPMMASQSDEEMGGTQEDEDEEEIDFGADDDEDYEAEETLSDDDDTSWKVRKCAAKVLYALISTRGADLVDNGTLYERIAPSLVKRFNEREENVRLEILVTVALLVKKTSEVVPSSNFAVEVVDHVPAAHSAKSRKRRRGSSDEAMLEDPAYSRGNMSPALSPSPTYGPRAELGRIGPSIFKGVIKLFGQKSVPTRQAATMLLKEFVLAKHGCLTDELTQIMDPVMETIKTPSTSALGSMASSAGGLSSATGNSLRIESLQFICVLCDTHSSKVLVPHLNKIVPSLITAVNDNYFKIACEAIDATESVVKALTPPRALGSDGTSKNYVEAMFDAVLEKARNSSADLEVRQRAIHALGICLARTLGGSRLLSPSKREQGLVALNERLKGETTRLASVQALDHLMTSLTRKDEFQPAWAESVAVELSNQLRKADRRLRGASLVGMKRLSANHVVLESLGEPTVQTMTAQILPLLDDSNLSHLTLGIEVLTEMIRKFPQTVASEKLFDALCRVVVATLGRHALEAFLSLVDVIGAQRVGKPLMQMFLQVGVNGDSAIVGRAIGALVVSGGSTVGVSTLDFQKELQTAQDDKRKCLALAILGEIALRRGSQSDLDPSIFLQHFTSKSELVSRLAAISLGRAAAGNVPTYLPIILSTIKQSGSTQFLLLHSIRETLQNANKARTELSQFTGAIWSHLLEISGSEDNKVVGAECVGRLAGFEPKKYLPLLQTYLNDRTTSVRGMVIQAVRFALSDTDETFDEVLKPIIIKMLITMLNDSNLENRRLALVTLNSATGSKPNLILPQLPQLLPYVFKATIIDTKLIREVQMGPFRHKVDDGLENRKSAYETLNALIDTAFPMMDRRQLFDRVVEGLGDEHEIKLVCNVMLTKLMTLDPDETVRRLDAIAEKFLATVSIKLKENSVKQEVEKKEESIKDVLRATVRLISKFPTATLAKLNSSNANQNWNNFLEWVGKELPQQFTSAETEVKRTDLSL